MTNQKAGDRIGSTTQPTGWIKATDASPEAVPPLKVSTLQVTSKGKEKLPAPVSGGWVDAAESENAKNWLVET